MCIRDSNKLGRELELLTKVDVIGQGLPLRMPKGTKMIMKLQRWIEDLEDKEWGYVRTKTPVSYTHLDVYKRQLSDRVVLKQLEAEETTKSGIILTSSAQEKPQEAEVIAVGPGGIDVYKRQVVKS